MLYDISKASPSAKIAAIRAKLGALGDPSGATLQPSSTASTSPVPVSGGNTTIAATHAAQTSSAVHGSSHSPAKEQGVGVGTSTTTHASSDVIGEHSTGLTAHSVRYSDQSSKEQGAGDVASTTTRASADAGEQNNDSGGDSAHDSSEGVQAHSGSEAAGAHSTRSSSPTHSSAMHTTTQ